MGKLWRAPGTLSLSQPSWLSWGLLLLNLGRSSKLLYQKSVLQMTNLPKMAISWNDQFAKYFLPISVLPEHHLNHFTTDLSDQQSLMLVKLVFHIQKEAEPFGMHNLTYAKGRLPSKLYFIISFPNLCLWW